ncbi:secretin and TonB N-terminal domain-containing protein [Bradyrhizobium embrapense]|uniref:secretin and TonB N-terminal domain-containing protein n=1 Tax=Bradyrhizobium embrapense TaxID=630921 RepID=UPI000ACD1F34|nr:secretin and TonB N-terminal domain-containing protein [Bradyrhizobium embrapense]
MTPDAPARVWSARRLCRALMFWVCLVAAPPSASAQEAQIDFDIAAQPLAAALEQYGAVAGRNVLYNSNLTAGLRSSAVRGPMTADMALARLLAGSGLSARVLGETSFMLYPIPTTAQAVLPVSVSHYYARLQTGLRAALCAEADARPGRYRIALQFWIDPAGNVERFARLGSAGSAAVDAGIDHALRRIRVDVPPPAGLAQPVTLVVVPQGSGTTMACDGPPARRASATP